MTLSVSNCQIIRRKMVSPSCDLLQVRARVFLTLPELAGTHWSKDTGHRHMARSGWLIFQCAEGQMRPLFIQPLDFTHAVREPGTIPWRGYQTTVNSGPPWAAQAAVGYGVSCLSCSPCFHLFCEQGYPHFPLGNSFSLVSFCMLWGC